MRAGEWWAYRERRGAAGKAVQRALIEDMGEKGSKRVLIRIEADGALGEAHWLPRGRLLAPWDEAERLVEEECRKAAAVAASESPDQVVGAAVDLVLEICPPMLGMWIGHRSQDLNLVSIRDVAAAATWLGVEEAALMALPGAFVDRTGRFWAPWAAAEPLARMVVAAYPEAVLEVIEWERRDQELVILTGGLEIGCPPGALEIGLPEPPDPMWAPMPGETDPLSGTWAPMPVPWGPLSGVWAPEPGMDRVAFQEWEAVFDLVRSWCGVGPVERFDENAALRAEVERLRSLLLDIAGVIESGGHHASAQELIDVVYGGAFSGVDDTASVDDGDEPEDAGPPAAAPEPLPAPSRRSKRRRSDGNTSG